MPSNDLIQLIMECIQECYACDHTYAFPTLHLTRFSVSKYCPCVPGGFTGDPFSLDKSKDNFISCCVCDAKFVHHVVYFVH